DLAGPRRWLRLQIRPPTGSGGVLVRPGDGGVHAHIPTDQPQRVGPALQPAQNPRPDALPLPTPEQAIDRLPMPVTVRHIPPRRPSAHPPPDPVNELPLTPLRRPTRLPTPGQQRLQHRPLRVAQVEPPRHRYSGHELSVLMAVLVDEPSTGDLATCRSPTHPADQLTTNHHPLLKHGLVHLLRLEDLAPEDLARSPFAHELILSLQKRVRPPFRPSVDGLAGRFTLL